MWAESIVARLPFALVIWVLFLSLRSIYRLSFHPLRHIPGPKLAAVTHLYEFYFDVICRGRYIWQIQKLHAKYGPIIRISPREIHVADASFYDEIYAPSSRIRDKDSKWVPTFGLSQSMLSTVGHRQHRLRRSLLSSFFSKKSVLEIGPLIERQIAKLSRRLENLHGSQEVVQLDAAFVALTSDIISAYCYGESGNFLDNPGFRSDIRASVMDATAICHWVRFFPFLLPLLQQIPETLMRRLMPGKIAIINFQRSLAAKAAQALRGERKVETNQDTIYDRLINEAVPREERTLGRIHDESSLVLAAGTETTGRILTVAMYYLSKDQSILRKLRAELKTVLPSPTSSVTWVQLEQLPYLTAVVRESLRLGMGITCRLPRVAPNEVLQYGKYHIPAGTPMSTCTMLVQRNPDIFPDPDRFDPERWISDGQVDNKLMKYLVSFTRGSRMCLGINLAYSELYLLISHLARQFTFEICNTSDDDVRITRDMMVGYTRRGDLQVYAKVAKVIEE